VSKMADGWQRQLMEAWRDHTGFEFMGRTDVRAALPADFIARWEGNVQWLRDVATEAERMIDDYRHDYEEGLLV